MYIYIYRQYENIDRYFTYLTAYLGSTSKWDVIHPPRHPFDKLSDCVDNSGGRVPVPGAYGTVVNFTPTRWERVRCSWGMVIHETGLEKKPFL